MDEYLIEFYGEDLETGVSDNHRMLIMADKLDTVIDAFLDTAKLDYMRVISFKVYLCLGEAVQREGDLDDTNRQSN